MQKNINIEKKLKIVLIGGTHRALVNFSSLLKRNDIEIFYFIIQEDYSWDPQWHPKLEQLAKENNIPYETYPSGKKLSDETIQKIENVSPDVIIGAGIWRAILSSELWKTCKYGYIGLHGSLLPAYRGFANLNWYMINGEKEYGMRMIQLDEGIDSGKLVCGKDGKPIEAFVNLDIEKTIADILKEVEEISVKKNMELIDMLIKNEICFIDQDESQATWACHRGPEDGEIDWTKSSLEIHNFVRALSQPYPGAFSFFKNKKFFIWRTTLPKESKQYVGRITGKVVGRNQDGSVEVLTSNGIIKINEISVDGNKVKPSSFINSVREKLGYNPRLAIQNIETKIEDIKKEFHR